MNSELGSDFAAPPWEALDIVLLDMDGTLLDLRFDNYFWRELVPERYAERRRMTTAQAVAELAPRFAAAEGTLDWYCTDYWSRELGLDIAGLKHEARGHIRFLPGAEAFLRWLGSHRAQVVLITNAHHDSLKIKAAHTGLDAHFDALVSSHTYGVPKEHEKFWHALEREIPFAREHALFIDDSMSVLRAARRHGIAHIIAIARPDSTAARREIDEFQVVDGVADLIPSPARTHDLSRKGRGG